MGDLTWRRGEEGLQAAAPQDSSPLGAAVSMKSGEAINPYFLLPEGEGRV